MKEQKGDLSEVEIKPFLTLPAESLILAKRTHWWVAFKSIFAIFVVCTILLIPSIFITTLLGDNLLTFLYVAIIGLLAITSIATTIINWYYHFYVITSRKILEVKCLPFYSDTYSDVFLDQVRTTEVDSRIGNIVDEFLDIGDVQIIFDRPSHEKEFILKNIHDPWNTSKLVGDALENVMNPSPVWFTKLSQNKGDYIKFSEYVPHDDHNIEQPFIQT